MPEIDWDRVPGTEVTFPYPVDGHPTGVLKHYNHQRRSWVVQVCPGRCGTFRGRVQVWNGDWEEVTQEVDEPQLVTEISHEMLEHYHESGIVRLPTKPTMMEALAAALNEGLADAERARRRAEGLADD